MSPAPRPTADACDCLPPRRIPPLPGRFTPDGKYRMQMFALEDQNDGKIAVYLPDVLNDAVRTKILKKADTPDDYAIVGSMRNLLHVEALDSQNTPEPPNHMKNMLGWGR